MPLASSSKGCRSTSGFFAHSRTSFASRIVQLLIFAPIAHCDVRSKMPMTPLRTNQAEQVTIAASRLNVEGLASRTAYEGRGQEFWITILAPRYTVYCGCLVHPIRPMNLHLLALSDHLPPSVVYQMQTNGQHDRF